VSLLACDDLAGFAPTLDQAADPGEADAEQIGDLQPVELPFIYGGKNALAQVE
jgi:hypothetical protein